LVVASRVASKYCSLLESSSRTRCRYPFAPAPTRSPKPLHRVYLLLVGKKLTWLSGLNLCCLVSCVESIVDSRIRWRLILRNIGRLHKNIDQQLGWEEIVIIMSEEHGERKRAERSKAASCHLNHRSQSDSRSMIPPSVEKSRHNSGEQGAGDMSIVESNPNFEMSTTTGPNIISTKHSQKESNPRSLSEMHSSTIREQPALFEPPVTKTTLSELDVNKIVHNPKLRHDINFDPDLHFRPNLDGDKGRRKTDKTNAFYEVMRIQLEQYFVNREQFEKKLENPDLWCLPATLKAIEEILETLVPQRDRSSVEETFNVELLMQQFRKGVADLPKLALWLSQLLKRHCAPMRDIWVDDMVKDITKGDQEGDVAILVSGIRHLLGVLEAMKLVSSPVKTYRFFMH